MFVLVIQANDKGKLQAGSICLSLAGLEHVVMRGTREGIPKARAG